jgi:1-acyl-sn-glycerol-3-phosphate acyltransferase
MQNYRINRSLPPVSLLLRSVLFNALFYVNLVGHMLAALPTLALPANCIWIFVRSYARISLWLLRVVCGTGVDWRGLEKIPRGAVVVASKHQSTWDTFALLLVLDKPVYIIKRELTWIPLFGWLAWKAGMIAVDRGARSQALAAMTERARAKLARGIPIIIFPEGTRRTPGAEPRYKFGVAQLYAETGVPCVPIALNSGLYWPRRSFRRFPGTVRVEILDPIAPGIERGEFFARLERVIEDATARLVAEGMQELGRSDAGAVPGGERKSA